MSKNLEIKKQVVADIVEKFKAAQSVVVCSYSGLTVEQVTKLRAECRKEDVHYVVLKNRLVNRALQELGIAGLEGILEGPNAFVFGNKDVTNAPKIVNDFIEKNKLTSLEIKGGLMGEEVLDVAAVKGLASLPSRDELLATLVGCLQSPVSSLVAVLDEIAEKLEKEAA
ncbi:MAG: 50S ribosomal protein L10 [Clostridia bacterium]|nr:50S ribosomal protein L10 [Clostridia bacterium]